MTHPGAAEKPFFRHGRPTAAAGVAVLTAVLLLARITSAAALAPVNLGTASSFGVLAGTGVTNTGATTINGDLGACPTGSVTGAPTVTGTSYTGPTDAVCLQAKSDLVTAYLDAEGRTPPTATYTAALNELGGSTLVEGVYKTATAFQITGELRLDGQGNPDAVFIFQAGSTLNTAVGSSIVLENQAQACNVFWQVGSSAVLGGPSTFVGTIMALTTITANSGAQVQGRLLARNGAVNLNNNVITVPTCSQATTSSTAGNSTSSTAGNSTSSTAGNSTSSTAGNSTSSTAANATSSTAANSTVRPSTTSRVSTTLASPGQGIAAPAGGSGVSTTPTTVNPRTGTATLPRTGPPSSAELAAAALAVIVTGGLMVRVGSRRRHWDLDR